MSLTIYDAFGNFVSILLVVMMPITSRLFNILMEKKGGFGGTKEQVNTYKAYISYARNFSLLFTSLFFSLANSLYLMLKDGLSWEYVIFGFAAFILIAILIIMHFYLNQYNIDQPFTQFVHERFNCDFDILNFQSYPLWAKFLWFLDPTRVFMIFCTLSYVVPSIIILEKSGYI